MRARARTLIDGLLLVLVGAAQLCLADSAGGDVPIGGAPGALSAASDPGV